MLFPLILGATSLVGCQKENSAPSELKINQTTMSADSARTEFSKILSKAVYNEPEVRKFLKAKAMEEFDNDNDVFYPFVKHEIVGNGETFRQILERYAGESEVLDNIEEALPLLNIYVPNLTSFFAFNASLWDLGDREIAVTALNQNNDPNTFYGNGEKMFDLELNEIPGFPCLVVKNSERIILKNNIKVKGAVGKGSYEFAADAFDKRLNTKSTPATSTENRDMIINAWQEFGVDPTYWQRDYIYYGMSHANPKDGRLNPQIREYVEMIKFDPSIISMISDQIGDPFLKDKHEHSSDDKNPLSYDQISRALWTDGNFEFYIYVTKGKRTGSVDGAQKIILSVNPTEVFSFKKILHSIKGGGIFHRDKHTYRIESPVDIEAKWYFPYNGAGVALEKWDVSEESMNINFQIIERDDAETIEKSYSYKNTYSNSLNFKIDAGIGLSDKLKIDLGFGYTSTNSTEKTETTKILTTKNSDDLGTLTLYFSDPILRTNANEKKIGDGPWFFDNAYTMSNGAVTMQVLPKKL